jgi:hypothetical protein
MEFAQTFDGSQATVKRLNITVSEESSSQITGLSRQGERWYKNFRIAAKSWSPFLKEPSPLLDLRRGIHRDALSPQNEVVFFLQKFITCEGRFSVVYHYHVRILMHLIGCKPLNMPYYLHKSSTKMAESMRKKKSPDTALYHKGFIMMILNAELERLGVPWSTFVGQATTKPQATVLPPKKKLSQMRGGMTPWCRRSTRISKRVMGSRSHCAHVLFLDQWDPCSHFVPEAKGPDRGRKEKVRHT